jgi:hypothetical protein
MTSHETQVNQLLATVGLDGASDLVIHGSDPVIPSRFRIGEAAATALAACGEVANQLWMASGRGSQLIRVAVRGAAGC